MTAPSDEGEKLLMSRIIEHYIYLDHQTALFSATQVAYRHATQHTVLPCIPC
jgi:hypothetical protein